MKILKKVVPTNGSVSCDEITKFIELGKVLGYDVKNVKADLKKD